MVSPYQYSQNISPNLAFLFLENSMSVASPRGNSIVSFKVKCGTYILNYFSCITIIMLTCMVS